MKLKPNLLALAFYAALCKQRGVNPLDRTAPYVGDYQDEYSEDSDATCLEGHFDLVAAAEDAIAAMKKNA